MVIVNETIGFTIKQAVESQDYIRIGVTQICYVIDGKPERPRPIGKPHNDFTIGELTEIYEDFQRLRGVRRAGP